jgi:flagella basal body P-ring formation protein FlgA
MHKFTILLLSNCLLGGQLLALGSAAEGTIAMAEQTIQTYFATSLNLSMENILVEIDDLDKKLTDLPAFDEVRVLPAKHGAKTGIQILRCGFYLKASLQGTQDFKVRVRTFETLVVAAGLLPRHTILTEDHLTKSKRETTNLTQDVYKETKDLSGLRTKRILQPGRILTTSAVEEPPVVERGATIDLRFLKGGLEITLQGVARQDGRIGETIQVKCTETKKLFRGEIVDGETVIVAL